jgi:two-component system alkaline phosphatase synthesis response regulator PhoP
MKMGEAGAKKILIVEDDPDTQESVKLVLEQEGYTTVTAGDAKEGLKKVRAERPDLILLDVMMPEGTEGFHFVWELRKDEDAGLRDLPIIVLTAIHGTTPFKFYPDQSDGVYGPNEYLPVQAFFDKPVPFDELIAEVKKLLGSG